MHLVVDVSSSVWWFMNGNCVLYLSHAMLVLAELIVCSTRGFACILAKWFWPTVMSLSLTYGSPKASCNKRANTYFGRRSASLMKEFWTLCILVMTVSETVMVETIPYLDPSFCRPISLDCEICCCRVLKFPQSVL